MPGVLQTKRPLAGNQIGVERSGVALVAREDQRRRIGAILEKQGLEIEGFDTVDVLLEGDSTPALIVLWVEGALSAAVASDLEPLRRAMLQAPVVVICDAIRPGDLRAALAAGASGVVLEDHLAMRLGPCLQAALAGQICVPRLYSRQIEPAALSSREKQILGLVVMGYMNSQIAEQLFLAESTVKSHLSSAFVKLGVRSRNEAVDLILDAERGLGMGILGLGGEPLESAGRCR